MARQTVAIMICHTPKTRRALSGGNEPPTKVFRRLTKKKKTASVNENIVKPCVVAVVGRKTILKPYLTAVTNTYMSDFPNVKFHVAWLIRQQRKQGSGIQTITRIGIKS